MNERYSCFRVKIKMVSCDKARSTQMILKFSAFLQPSSGEFKGIFSSCLFRVLNVNCLLSKNILWIIFRLSSVARIYSVWVRSDVEEVERVHILSGVLHSQIRCSGVSPFSVLFKILKYCIATTVSQEVNS